MTPNLLRAFRARAASLLKRKGVFDRLKESAWRQRRLLILCFHGIAIEDEQEWAPRLFLTSEKFERRLRMLRDGGYHVLPLAEALERLYGGSLPPASVVITFDDGLYDFYRQAHPLLRKYNLPATLYWTTYYSGRNQPVFNIACDYILWKGRGGILPDYRKLGFSRPPALNIPRERKKAHAAVLRWAEQQAPSTEAKGELLARVAEGLGVDYNRFLEKRILQLITPQEAGDLARQGVDLQLHTHRHRTPFVEGEFRNEIAENRRVIQALTGVAPRHFCYPSGFHDPRFVPWLKAEGVDSAVTCETRLAGPRASRYRLPRYLDSMLLPDIDFEGWLCGARAFLSVGALWGRSGRYA